MRLQIIVTSDFKFAIAQNLLYVAQILLRLGHQRALRILQDECLEFVFGGLRLRRVPVSLFHHAVMRHTDLHLRVGGFVKEREKRDEIFVLGNGLRRTLSAALFIIRIGDRKFGLSASLYIWIG